MDAYNIEILHYGDHRSDKVYILAYAPRGAVLAWGKRLNITQPSIETLKRADEKRSEKIRKGYRIVSPGAGLDYLSASDRRKIICAFVDNRNVLGLPTDEDWKSASIIVEQNVWRITADSAGGGIVTPIRRPILIENEGW